MPLLMLLAGTALLVAPRVMAQASERQAPPSRPRDIAVMAVADAARYTNSIAAETNKIAVTAVDVLGSKPGVLWAGIVRAEIGGREKQVLVALAGSGEFRFERQEPMDDPVFKLIVNLDKEWHILKGVEKAGSRFGSWAFVLSTNSLPDASRAEKSLPLSAARVTNEGKLCVLKFSGASGELILYVPGRHDRKWD